MKRVVWCIQEKFQLVNVTSLVHVENNHASNHARPCPTWVVKLEQQASKVQVGGILEESLCRTSPVLKTSMSKERNDCMVCRITGTLTLSTCSGYLFFLLHQQSRRAPMINRVFYGAGGVTLAALAIWRGFTTAAAPPGSTPEERTKHETTTRSQVHRPASSEEVLN